MFVGTVPSSVREMIVQIAATWRGSSGLYVGCSGNFTIESAVQKLGIPVHSNDVSLYSCRLGAHLMGYDLPLAVKHEPLMWMNEYLATSLDKVATLVLCLEYLPAAFRLELPFFSGTWEAVARRWPDLHERTKAQVKDATDGKLKIASYTPMDVVDYVEQVVPEHAGIMAFPPTYKNGYERLFKSLDATFAWEAPKYTIFDEARFTQLVAAMQRKRHWAIYVDRDVPELAENLVGLAQATAKSHPVRIYASGGRSRLVTPVQKLEPVNVTRLSDGPDDVLGNDLTLSPITQGQLNTLRSEYLGTNIIPVAASLRWAVTSGGKLLGAMAFSPPNYLGEWCDAYMMTDFAIAPTRYPRLSKLVLAATMSREVKDMLAQQFVRPVLTIGSTAFTEKPVSMKYRSMYDLHSRKPGKLNYIGQAGKWTLAEAFQWWKQKHGQQVLPHSSNQTRATVNEMPPAAFQPA